MRRSILILSVFGFIVSVFCVGLGSVIAGGFLWTGMPVRARPHRTPTPTATPIPFDSQMLALGPTHFWPLRDTVGSTSAVDLVAGLNLSLPVAPFVQSAGNNCYTINTVSSEGCTFAANPQVGDTIVVFTRWGNTTSSITSVTDTLGNVFTPVSPALVSVVNSNKMQAFIAPVTHTGADTVVMNLSAAISRVGLTIAEYKGNLSVLASASLIDAATPLSGTVSPTLSGQLLVAGFNASSDVTAVAAGNPFFLHTAFNTRMLSEDLVYNSVTPIQATATMTGGTAYTGQILALGAAFDSAVLALNPTHYWPLKENAGSTSAVDMVAGLNLSVPSASPTATPIPFDSQMLALGPTHFWPLKENVGSTSAVDLVAGLNLTVPSTPTPTPPTPTPTPSSTPTPIAGARYVDNAAGSGCNDAGAGTLAMPWCTVAKVNTFQTSLAPGNSVLFKCGDTWNEQLTLNGVSGAAGNPITFGHYGSNCVLPNQTYTATLPKLNGGSTRQWGIYAAQTLVASYVTIDGFDVHDTTEGGIIFDGFSSSSAVARRPGIIIKNNLVHQVGAGACAGCGSPNDDNMYSVNQGIGFTNTGTGSPDAVQILNNTVWDTGGHNTMHVHGDISPNALVSGNLVGPGCKHNCIDVKMFNGLVTRNITTCPAASARGSQCITGPSSDAGFYTENTLTALGTTSPTWTYNIAHDIPIGFQWQSVTSPNAYNNTVYNVTAFGIFASNCTAGDIRKNILAGPITHTCITTSDYNDYFNTSGYTAGAHDINVNPAYVAPNANPPDFHPTNSTVLTAGAGSNITPDAFLGALPGP